ncbi:hypothetical protein FT663_04536 [Candidozyma haemuli var. vulneris]|uniref:Uncharacterized protein n=1 Tax=Candidozyma haemuli TaxID=45357 RepID=A0A2V1AUC0_9ASCO|nr:hypothetical protein CXQ85_000359 [[Candida] haemuloni]KAF3986393.1 hypothetical protein FT662_04582 [[Candida] haemuloni var. vulneris]KAF3987229.1 hypothetical protein FT663_04536 [[Candida] haemuloni var. vulneris]PVH21382.1 hypothetical protein CXQ85_000359 [[Candida] haemuloni]
MACLAKFRNLVVFTVLFYGLYLFTYKCPQVVDHPIESSAKSIFSPLASTHKHLCGHLNHGHQVATPYIGKVHQFLDDHVHSTAFFKDNKIEDKIQCAKGKFNTHVHPYVVKVWEGVEFVEAQAFDLGYKAYGHAEQHFHKTIQPKAEEFKDAVVNQAEAVKDEVHENFE